jgi:hypothetical protein
LSVAAPNTPWFSVSTKRAKSRRSTDLSPSSPCARAKSSGARIDNTKGSAG